MISVKETSESPKVQEIREKMRDKLYIQGAVFRIAQVLSDKLIEIKEGSHERQ